MTFKLSTYGTKKKKKDVNKVSSKFNLSTYGTKSREQKAQETKKAEAQKKLESAKPFSLSGVREATKILPMSIAPKEDRYGDYLKSKTSASFEQYNDARDEQNKKISQVNKVIERPSFGTLKATAPSREAFNKITDPLSYPTTAPERGFAEARETAFADLFDFVDTAITEVRDKKIAGKIYSKFDIDEKAQAWAKNKSDEIRTRVAKKYPQEKTIGGRLLRNLGSGGHSLLEAMAVTYATGNPFSAGVLFGAKARTQGVKGALESGKTIKQAQLIGNLKGSAEGLLEYVGLDNLVKVGGKPLMRMAKGALTEGIQEFSQEFAGKSIDFGAGLTDINKQNALKAIQDSLYAGMLGAILGGGAGIAINSQQHKNISSNLQQLGLDKEDADKKAEEMLEKAIEGAETIGNDIVESTEPKPTIGTIADLKKEIAPKKGNSIAELKKELAPKTDNSLKAFKEEIGYVEPKKTRISEPVIPETDNNLELEAKKAVEQETEILRGTKGMTADDIMKTYPNIKLTRDVPAKDVHGNKVIIPEGEKLTPYEMKDGKILLQDGQTYLVSKNQFANIKGNAVGGEAKPFAPELKGTEETTLQTRNLGKEDIKKVFEEPDSLGENRWVVEFNTGQRYVGGGFKNERENIVEQAIKSEFKAKGESTKYSQYQLPEGTNYKEVLIKAPAKIKEPVIEIATSAKQDEFSKRTWDLFDSEGKKIGRVDGEDSANQAIDEWNTKLNKPRRTEYVGETFKSSHWDEPNVLSHLRMNDRTYKGKDVTFMEELQSDWARELRDKKTEATNPLLKKWQEWSVKRALQEAVNNKSDYFAWINGEQTSARYNLATQLDNVKWNQPKQGGRTYEKEIILTPKDGQDIFFSIRDDGTITPTQANAIMPTDWVGKKLDEVIGKGLADKIMAEETGTLSGEGLKFGGEWAINLYDKQVANIVKKLTGAEVIEMDMGLPIEGKTKNITYLKDRENVILTKKDIKVGKRITADNSEYIITAVLGDGKFKAVPIRRVYQAGDLSQPLVEQIKNQGDLSMLPDGRGYNSNMTEQFDISTEKTTQQGIKLTPEVVAKIKGKAPVIETSGKKFKEKATEKSSTVTVKQAVGKKVEKEQTTITKPTDKDKIISTHYERIKKEFGFDEASIEVDKMTAKQQKKKIFAYIQKNPEKSIKMGYNVDAIPSQYNPTMFRASLVASLRASGDLQMAEDIAKIQSQVTTSAARTLVFSKQDIQRGAGDKLKIVQNITDDRLQKIGEGLGEIDPDKAIEKAKTEVVRKNKQNTEKWIAESAKTAEQKISDLDSIIDSLLC